MNWDALTGIGTTVLAAMTLAAVVATIVITRQDRRRADERLAEERRSALDQEQLSEAWAVEVDMTQTLYLVDGQDGRRLWVTVVNRGRSRSPILRRDSALMVTTRPRPRSTSVTCLPSTQGSR